VKHERGREHRESRNIVNEKEDHIKTIQNRRAREGGGEEQRKRTKGESNQREQSERERTREMRKEKSGRADERKREIG
jgi:hypothetical protein